MSVFEDNQSSELLGVGWQILPLMPPSTNRQGAMLVQADTHRAGTHQDPSTPDHPLLPPPFTDLYNTVLREGFFNFKLARSPSTQKKFCKNFKSLIGGRMEITDVLLVIGGLAIAGSLYLQYRDRKK